MPKPPDFIDGARVLKWAWSGQVPFGYVENSDGAERIEIYGLAICKYANNSEIYRFSCDVHWNTVQDSWYESVAQAIEWLPEQYRNVKAEWHNK